MFHYLFTAILDFIIVGLAISKKRKGLATAFTALCFGVWQLELFFLSYIKNLDLLYPIFHLSRCGLFFIPFCFALTTYTVVGIKSKRFKYGFVIPSGIFALGLGLSNIFLFPSKLALTEEIYSPVLDTLYYYFIGFLSVSAITSSVYTLVQYKHTSARDKQNVKWMLFTLFIVLVTGVSAAAAAMMNFSAYLQKFYAAFTNLIFMAAMYYTTTNQDKMELPVAATIAITKLFILSIFIFSFFIIASSMGTINVSPGTIFLLILYIYFIIYTYPLLLNTLLPIAKKAVSSDFHDIDEDKRQLSQMINESTDTKELAQILNYFLKFRLHLSAFKLLLIPTETHETHRSNTGSLIQTLSTDTPALLQESKELKHYLLKDELPKSVQQELDRFKCQAIFPVTNNKQLIAILATGKAPNKNHYSHDDRQLLEFLCNELSISLHRIGKYNITQEELAEARKTLSLVGVMNQYHHDIKTPLAIIDGVISEDIYEQDKQKTIVLEQVERGTKLIATMASILRGKRTSKHANVHLENILQDSLFIFENRFNQVIKEFSTDAMILGDAIDLKIMLVNVIKNAAEASPKHQENTLHIKTWDEANFVFLSIEDSGTGMSKDKLEELRQHGQLDSQKHTGSGVGLQAIQRIAEEHNTEIEINSSEGIGTTFTFKFPIKGGEV